MELRPLLQEEIAELRAMVEIQTDSYLQSADPQQAFVRGAPYLVDWTLNSLTLQNLERVRWFLSEIGFTAGSVVTHSVPSGIPGVHNEFFTMIAQRGAFFLPDCLWGEALVIGGVACSWDVLVESFELANDSESRSRAFQSQYGPMGRSIA
jgi:hypothetical protein